MKPVVTNLDKLNMEREAYMGVLLPTISVIWDSLRALKAKSFKYPRSLLEYLPENPHSDKRSKCFKNRFLSLFDQMEFLMAPAIHPLFKLPVVRLPNPEKVDAVKSKLLFEALRSPGPKATEGTNSSRLSNKMGKELESWCSEKQRNKLLEQAIFPALFRATWVDVFVKYKTAIPSSAAVKRLFSQGSDIMKATRTSLTSDNFERLVFMKGNMDMLNMELSPEDSE
ncbi:hypothetical protein GWK47_002679 [Chionoecetes opilio]|uniref:HAT C-terminal dimerisation domain-containing protein n=1 Tax=Chionoecetes opilio TaxID=41210 RepID=A0A8J4XVL7_CHIOP|nr:hypothetical protein GWK47_002679 [Chionoecetes opilio]